MRSIFTSVGENGRNAVADVRTVQELLNETRRNSVSPLLAVDGIAGPKTIAAIREFQRPRLGFADGRVDPGGATISALNAESAPSGDRIRCGDNELGDGRSAQVETRSSFVGDSGGSEEPRVVALRNAPEAAVWIGASLAALQLLRGRMEADGGLGGVQGTVELNAINTHFHFDRHPNPRQFLIDLGRNYTLINIAIAGANTNFANDFGSDDFANSDPGGFATRNAATNPGRMFFCRKYADKQFGALSKVVTIIHEAAHYIDKQIDHFASAVPFPAGRPLNGPDGQPRGRNYLQITPDECFRNAASYAGFAIFCGKRQDLRPTVTQ